MAPAGLVSSITTAALGIDFGRKGFATKGKAEEARISYEKGITEALSVFKEAQTNANPQTLILAEYAFITQELQYAIRQTKTH